MRATLAFTAVAGVMLLLAGDALSVQGIGRFRESQISYRELGSGAGRTEVWRTRVYTYRGEFVGTGALTCTFIDSRTSFRQCIGTYVLPLGKISVAGAIINRSAFEMVVFAGTRYYAGSTGIVITRRFSRTPPQSFITFYLGGT